MGNMTSVRFPEFLLLLLLLHRVHSEAVQPVFKAEGSVIEMGYCFGVDYIAVYRSAPEGDQLLGNSSANDPPITPPPDFQGRIHINENDNLFGLQIHHLTHMDSGIYRRECWQNHTLVTQHTHQLTVCDEELEAEEITVNEDSGRTELRCNGISAGQEGTSVLWFHELYPSYNLTLFLDSSVSLDPLVEELQGVMEVREGGVLVLLNNSLLMNNNQFYCLVIKGKDCLSFQNMYLHDYSESRDIFASQGDRVVLKCASDGSSQQWDTPQGKIDGSSVKNDQMYISFGDNSEDFSLVIPAFSEDQSGDYSCISSSAEVQYAVVLCPLKKSQKKGFFEGGNISLHCDIGEDDFQRVQWYREDPSGDHELIHDSGDETVPIPVDLSGRLTLSETDAVLTISHLKVQHKGLYWCVVSEFLEEYDGFDEDYDERDIGTDELSSCIFKQETILSLTTNRGPSNTANPNVAAYAVGAGLMLLLVVGVIALVIKMKRRAKASPKQRDRLNTTRDISMEVDPGCTERLRGQNEEHGA